MQEKILLKISLIISILGIFLLLTISNLQNPALIPIKNLNECLINKNVQIQGSIINIKDYDNFKILTVKDKTGKISVLLNKNNHKNLENNINLKLNQQITIVGKVAEYNEKLQINADKIIK
ncbi:MAG: OB-fold nucleic acid binding domain-containing protein [Candidatus Nanoarchaeia archaeon]|nr:OB-fold nucleic acid binding domain-containing protein [Candidatus Nanoarchaeia archaeon]